MVCGRSVPVQALGFGVWRSACSTCGRLEVNMSAVPEEITSADVIIWGGGCTFAQQIAAGRHRLTGDEPESVGGNDAGPSPYDLLLAALGSCTSMTVGMYARKRRWPLENITVSLRHSRIHAADCEDCETKEGKIDRIDLDIQLTGSLTDEQRAKLIEVAGNCPVHQTLTSEINIKTRV